MRKKSLWRDDLQGKLLWGGAMDEFESEAEAQSESSLRHWCLEPKT